MCQGENISKILFNEDICAEAEVNVFLLNSLVHPKEHELRKTSEYLPVHRLFHKQNKP